ncbi:MULTISPECIES: hypothetical protein [unclassified Nonomuraea]|uniref:hypothetical protein n=1 Tax=unclassified Nonomuraea TaxID=2593643 RepID=UPI0033C57957
MTVVLALVLLAALVMVAVLMLLLVVLVLVVLALLVALVLVLLPISPPILPTARCWSYWQVCLPPPPACAHAETGRPLCPGDGRPGRRVSTR